MHSLLSFFFGKLKIFVFIKKRIKGRNFEDRALQFLNLVVYYYFLSIPCCLYFELLIRLRKILIFF